MSRPTHFAPGTLGPGVESRPPPERVISGAPVFTLWHVGTHPGTGAETGLWQATPGAFRSVRGGAWEVFTVLEGRVEVTEDGGVPVLYTAGSAGILPPGFRGVWNTLETTRKVYVSIPGPD